ETESQNNIFNTATEVVEVCCQTENSHNFGSRGNIEARLLSNAVGARSQSGDNAPQGTVIHIKYAPPDDFFQSEAVCLMLVQVIVEQSGNHVVCGGNGVKVARK